MTLRSRAITGLTQFLLTLGALLFISAWSLRFWQAWAFLAAFGAWGLVCCPPLMAAIVMRLKDEERYLVRHLAGYAEYRERTRYRLTPGLY
jgi:protein-S-isoprenylcysteine O-methyltransferase Ste14